MNKEELILIVWFSVNLLVCLLFAIPASRYFSTVSFGKFKHLKCFFVLIGVYFIEGLALGIGMTIPIFNIGLAFVWGIVFGIWLKKNNSAGTLLKSSLLLSIYTTFPAVSLIALPVMMALSGWDVLSSQAGIKFGIPNSLWPVNTILGFYVLLVLMAVLFKIVITVGEASTVFLFSNKNWTAGYNNV
jgi:hypothetical protein